MQNIPVDMNSPLVKNIEELRGRKDPEAIKAVAKEMEAMFAYEMIKVMRETTGKSSKNSLGNDTYMSMFDLEISKLFAERGLGLQDMLAKGLQNSADKASRAQQQDAQDKQTGTADQKQDRSAAIKALMPDNDQLRISSGYGMRHDPFSGDPTFHHGIDVPAPEGTEIHAVRKGTVVFSGEQQGYGNVVIIDHGDGYLSKYAHNRTNLVHKGQVVDTGTVIAQVGSTGRSTGPHMHFEVLYKGKSIDPNILLAQK